MVRIWLLFSLGREERRYFAAWVGDSHAANGSGPDGPVFAIGGLCTKGRRILWGELWVMRHNEACCPAFAFQRDWAERGRSLQAQVQRSVSAEPARHRWLGSVARPMLLEFVAFPPLRRRISSAAME
jgi:hypothetical protein